MKKIPKRVYIIAYVLVLIVIVFASCGGSKQEVGFPNKDIYYGMSVTELKNVFGEPKDSYNTESASICYIFDFENDEISGECIFEFMHNELFTMDFISKTGYDKSTAQKLSDSIERFYKNKDGFFFDEENPDRLPFHKEFGINDKNGATGRYVTVEEDYMGKITITAINSI
ncbi:MAG: hypothetical protein IJU04_04300 [Ruminococcus sp.]|nr:hypothetical protein [Ruminococcus sp.]